MVQQGFLCDRGRPASASVIGNIAPTRWLDYLMRAGLLSAARSSRVLCLMRPELDAPIPAKSPATRRLRTSRRGERADGVALTVLEVAGTLTGQRLSVAGRTPPWAELKTCLPKLPRYFYCRLSRARRLSDDRRIHENLKRTVRSASLNRGDDVCRRFTSEKVRLLINRCVNTMQVGDEQATVWLPQPITPD
jgi:hypothetical protein